jgi:dienelactone hydrolase
MGGMTAPEVLPFFQDVEPAQRAHPALPKLLVRVGNDYPFIAHTQDAFVAAARDADASLEVLEIPHASHGFEVQAYDAECRATVDRAMDWVATTVQQ